MLGKNNVLTSMKNMHDGRACQMHLVIKVLPWKQYTCTNPLTAQTRWTCEHEEVFRWAAILSVSMPSLYTIKNACCFNQFGWLYYFLTCLDIYIHEHINYDRRHVHRVIKSLIIALSCHCQVIMINDVLFCSRVT